VRSNPLTFASKSTKSGPKIAFGDGSHGEQLQCCRCEPAGFNYGVIS